MAVKHFILNDNDRLSEDQIIKVKQASARPPVYDPDNPELSDAKLKEFRRIHEKRETERHKEVRQNLTLRLKPNSINIAKELGKGYTGVLSRFLEDTLESNLSALQKYLTIKKTIIPIPPI